MQQVQDAQAGLEQDRETERALEKTLKVRVAQWQKVTRTRTQTRTPPDPNLNPSPDPIPNPNPNPSPNPSPSPPAPNPNPSPDPYQDKKNLRALLASLHEIAPPCSWKPVSMAELIDPKKVKKSYHRACLAVHPDKQDAGDLESKVMPQLT